MTTSEVWLVPHGGTEWSAAGRHTGLTDLPLTERGRSAARAVEPALRRHSFAAVLTSPLQRAQETCELAGLGDGAHVVDDLREWEYGDYEGLTTATIRESRPGWTVWRDGCPGGESAADVGVRADRVVQRLRAVDGDVAAVAPRHLLP